MYNSVIKKCLFYKDSCVLLIKSQESRALDSEKVLSHSLISAPRVTFKTHCLINIWQFVPVIASDQFETFYLFCK